MLTILSTRQQKERKLSSESYLNHKNPLMYAIWQSAKKNETGKGK
jgi:hypothetical protein